jgi:hypothetical protein
LKPPWSDFKRRLAYSQLLSRPLLAVNPGLVVFDASVMEAVE